MASPSITGIEFSSRSVGQYEKLELTLDISAAYENPFEPAEVMVDASFWGPSGERMDVPGFFMRDYRSSGGVGNEELAPTGEAGWRVRFAPTEIGLWRFVVAVRSREGTVISEPDTFTCVPSLNKGFVRVSAGNPRYFQYDNGEDFFCIGSNTGSSRRSAKDQDVAVHSELFGRMGDHSMNWVRVWIPNFEKEAGTLVNYDQKEAHRMDALLVAAEKNGVYLDLCMDWWRNFDVSEHEGMTGAFPVDHCYWTGRGGQCETVIQFFTQPWAKAQYKKRLRYTVARWGYSTSVFNWEFWNEVNCVNGFEPEYIVPWTSEMARELRRLDPWHHMINNSYGSFIVEPTMWRLPEVDYVKVHGYYHPTIQDYNVQIRARDMGDFASYWIWQIRDFGKPALQGEYGMVSENWGISDYCFQDREGISIHNGIWAALHAGSAGTAMYWWTRQVIMAYDLYHLYTPIARYLDGVRLTDWDLRPCRVATNRPQLRSLGLKGDGCTLIWLQNKDYTWWNAVVEKKAPEPVRGAVVEPGPMEKGRYRVEIWDTHTGEIIRADIWDYADARRYPYYSLPMPVEKDIALKVLWVSSL